MYFLRDCALAHDLQGERVTAKQELGYVLIFNLILTLITSNFLLYGYEMSAAEATSSPFWQKASDATALAFWLITYLFAYRVNQAGDGKHFIMRVLCLSVPISLQIFAFCILALLAALLMDFPLFETAHEGGLQQWGLEFLIGIYFLWRLTAGMRIASSAPGEQS